MKYITGIYALNLPSPDGTPGDWHFSALDWKNLKVSDTKGSIFKDWGLHLAEVPYHGVMPVANHVRACLDLIEQGNFGTAQGMRDSFIDDNQYTPIIFDKVSQLRKSAQWDKIDHFMGHEYYLQWLNFKKMQEHKYV